MNRFKALIYTQQFFSEAMPIYVFYAIMFANRSGLSVSEISLLFIIWGAVGLLAEVPTGVIADKYSRKYSIFFGGILRSLGFACWFLFPSFTGYALGFVLWGIGGAFNSGSFEAYLYDELKSRGKAKLYSQFYGRSQSMMLLGMTCAFVVAYFVGGDQYGWLIALSIFSAMLSAGLALVFPKERIHEAHPEEDVKPQYIKQALRHIKKSPLLARYVVTLGVLAGLLGSAEEFETLYYKVFEIQDPMIAALATFGIGLSALTAWFADKFESQKQRYRLIMIGLAGVLLSVTTFGSTVMAVIGIFGFLQLTSLAHLQYQAVMQHEITDKIRATTSSISSLLAELAALVMIGFYGLVAYIDDGVWPMRATGLCAVVLAIGLAWYWRTLRKRTGV